jgi:transcriptional repressor NrdR
LTLGCTNETFSTEMKCPKCSSQQLRVIETRSSNDNLTTRRRRECEKCGFRFSTQESVILTLPKVIKKNGKKEVFSKTKILRGVQAACVKRPVSKEQLSEIVKKVVEWAEKSFADEVNSKEIGLRVLSGLMEVDQVASVRFASVHQSFNDLNEFVSQLGKIE